jgi:hypothetical protein
MGGVALTVSAVLSAAAVQPARLSQAAADAAVKAITKDRAGTTWLRSDPSSYLAAIDRRDFSPQDADGWPGRRQ